MNELISTLPLLLTHYELVNINIAFTVKHTMNELILIFPLLLTHYELVNINIPFTVNTL